MSIAIKGMRAFAESVCVLLTLLPAVAQQSRLQSRWEQYTTANGLPSNRVLCVAVDANRVWAGTDNGLVLIERGQVAKVYQPQDDHSRIQHFRFDEIGKSVRTMSGWQRLISL